MMYDELVQSLRICSKCDFGQNCWGCKQKSDDVFCCDKLLHEAANAIEELQKQRKTGKWSRENLVATVGGTYSVVRCSECKAQFPFWETNYCPNCGAQMESEGE